MAPHRRTGTLAVIYLLLGLTGAAHAAQPTLDTIEPVRIDQDLGCRLLTADLPGQRMLSSMRSGLVSAMQLEVEILDIRDRAVARRQVSFRLAFDLWDEVYSTRLTDRSHVFADLQTLKLWLTSPPPIPLLPLSRLQDEQGPFCLRATLTLYPIAPRDRDRVQETITGDGDRNEATVSVGRLIRFFYADEQGRRDPAGAVRSATFQPEALPHALDPR